MKDIACIAIGINQYEFLEPLSYAQQDAEALYTLLIKEAGFPPEKCWLSHDSSPPRPGQATYPTRENIFNLIEKLGQKPMQYEDGLWFFFSGYGFSYQGEDYLMPIDGLISEVEATGIPVKMLMEKLKNASTNVVLLLLDICGEQNLIIDDRVGINTLALARAREINLVLSCSQSKVARESSALRHGFFTVALLEGLRSEDCTTLKGLENFLSYRLRELCDRHLRPRQNPLIVVNPPEKMERVIFPFAKMLSESNDGQEGKNNIRFQTNNLPAKGEKTMSQNTTQPIKSDKPFLQKLILTSGAVALVLLVGVFMTNKSVLLSQKTEPQNPTADRGLTPGPAISTPENPGVAPQVVSSSIQRQDANLSTDSQILLAEARASLGGISASRLSEAIAKASEIPPNDPLFIEAQQDIERWSWTILDIADGRAQQEDYNGAIAAAKLVPDFVTVTSQEAEAAIAQWEPLAQQLQVNEALLAAAKALIEPGQASSYNKAIDKAREVLPELPGAEEARRLIANWSDTIFNIALLRAERGNFSEAIRAAELVPPATPTYDRAQKAIADWKIKQRAKEKT